VGTPTILIKGEYMDIFKSFFKFIISKEFLVLFEISMLLLGAFLLVGGDKISNKRKKNLILILLYGTVYIFIISFYKEVVRI